MPFLFFVDKDCGSNLRDGLPYFASGIIEGDFREKGKPSVSGKDFSVVFIDPWGEVQREWRSTEDITMIEADQADFENLKEAIARIES